jgi:hypothetical protein
MRGWEAGTSTLAEFTGNRAVSVVFILLFTYVFGGAVRGTLPPAAAGNYVNWLVPGLLAQFALFGGGRNRVGPGR